MANLFKAVSILTIFAGSQPSLAADKLPLGVVKIKQLWQKVVLWIMKSVPRKGLNGVTMGSLQ